MALEAVPCSVIIFFLLGYCYLTAQLICGGRDILPPFYGLLRQFGAHSLMVFPKREVAITPKYENYTTMEF